MITLDSITTVATQKPWRIIGYGVPKVGKTTFGKDIPGHIFIPVEDGHLQKDVNAFPVPHNTDEIIEMLRVLYKESHDYTTVVLDSVTALQEMIEKEVCKDKWESAIASQGIAFSLMLTKLKSILDALDLLRERKGMNVFMIGHSKVDTINLPDQPAFTKYDLALYKNIQDFILKRVDAIFFFSTKVNVIKTNGVAKAAGKLERVIYTDAVPFCDAGNRYGLCPTYDYVEGITAKEIIKDIKNSYMNKGGDGELHE